MSGGTLEINLRMRAEEAIRETDRARQNIEKLKFEIHGAGGAFARFQVAARTAAEGIGAFAATAVGLVGGVAALGRGLAEAAAHADTHERAVTRLGDAYDLVRQATNDVVTAEQALRVQQSLSQAGHQLTAEQLAIVTRRAREYATATGTDLNQALDQVTDALRGMESEGLRRFGISVNSNRTYTENLTSAVNQMSASFHGTAPAVRTMEEDLSRTDRTFGQLAGSIATSIANLVHLREAMGAVSDLVSGEWGRRMDTQIANTARSAEHTAALNENTAARELAGRSGLTFRGRDTSAMTTAQLQALTAATQRAARIGDQSVIDAAFTAMDTAVARSLVENTNRGVAAGVQRERDAFEAQVQARTQAMYADGTKGSGGAARTAGHHNRNAGSTQSEGYADASQAGFAQGFGLFSGGLGWAAEVAQNVAFTEQVEENARRRQQAVDDEEKAMQESARSRAQTLAQMLDDERKANEERNSLQAQLAQRFAQHQELNQTTAQNAAGVIEGAYNTMTSALKTHIAAVIQGKEDVGTALKATLQEILLNLAAESATKAIMETALGFAALARGAGSYGADTGAVVSAPMHFTSAAMFAALAAGAGLGYAGVSAIGGAPAGAGASSFGSKAAGPASTRDGAPANDTGGSVTIINNVNGFAMSETQVQDGLVNAMDRAAARGVVPRWANQRRAA
jgi:hypothetical protein